MFPELAREPGNGMEKTMLDPRLSASGQFMRVRNVPMNRAPQFLWRQYEKKMSIRGNLFALSLENNYLAFAFKSSDKKGLDSCSQINKNPKLYFEIL